MEEKRAKIKMYREEASTIYRQHKQGNGGPANGNTARKAFANPELFADVTGVDVNLIKILHIVCVGIVSLNCIPPLM